MKTFLEFNNPSIILKNRLSDKKLILNWWQLEDKLTKEGYLNNKLKLSFFCPVYFAGQKIVKRLLNEKDEQGELILFALPKIKNQDRVKNGIFQMKRLGIKNPEQYLVPIKKDHNGNKSLPLYSSLPGVEGIGSGKSYDYIAYEAVQLGAFQIVPKKWLNAGDPYNQSYRFPGEKGYSPYWRIPSYNELKKMRPDLAKGFKKTNKGEIISIG